MEKVVLLVLGVFATHAAAQDSCTAQDLRKCLHFDMLTVATHEQARGNPNNGLDEFNAGCANLQSSYRCFEAMRSKCPHSGQLGMDVMKLWFDYLCGEGITGFVNNIQCFRNEDLQRGAAQCTSDMKSDGDSLISFAGSQEAKWEKACGYSRDFADCFTRVTGAHCPRQAVQVIRKYTILLVEFGFEENGQSCHIDTNVAIKYNTTVATNTNTAEAIETSFLSLFMTAILVMKNYM